MEFVNNLNFIKQEEPVDYFFIVEPAEDEIPDDMEIFDVQIKQEDTKDQIANEEANHCRSKYNLERDITDDTNVTDSAKAARCATDRNTSMKKTKQKCHKCPLAFMSAENLSIHILKHEQPTLDQCKICKKFFPKSMLQSHTEAVHPGYSCKICCKTFMWRRSWILHKSVHEEKSFQCDICSKSYRQKGALRYHMKVHCGERLRNFICEICKASFYRGSALNCHMLNVHSNTHGEQYRCPNAFCDKAFSSIKYFRYHICGNRKTRQKRSESDKIFSCTLCEKRFYDKYYLRNHMKRGAHYDNGIPKHMTCGKCQKGFKNLHRYVLHVAQNCPKIIMYECDYCSRQFSEKYKVISHFRRYHFTRNGSKKQLS